MVHVPGKQFTVHVQGKQFHSIYSQGATQCVCVCVTDVILLQNVLDLPFASPIAIYH